MLANDGEFNGKRILSANSVKELRIPRLSKTLEGIGVFNWGYAVTVRCETTDAQPLPIDTYGWSGAYSSHFFVEPKSKICAIMMTNTSNEVNSVSIAAFEKIVGSVFKKEKLF